MLCSIILSSFSQSAESNKIGVGLVGMGSHMTDKIIPALDQERFSFEYACRRDMDALKGQQKKYGISNITSDFKDILTSKHVQAIVVAGDPEKLHVPVVKAALENGYHVFVEKPISLSLEMIRDIAHSSEKSGKVAMVGFNMTHTPTINLLQQKFSQHFLSELEINCSLGVPQKDGIFIDAFNNSFYFSFIHAASVLSKIMGMPVDIKVDFKKTDECPNGFTFEALCKNKKDQKITLSFCSGITPSGFNLGIKYKDNGEMKSINLTDKNTPGGSEKQHSYKTQMDHFYDCIQKNIQPEINFQKNVEIHEIMEMIKSQIEM